MVENLALLRHTTAKHALSSAISSDRIVDGKRTKLYYGGGECFYTQNGHAFAVWYVDLAYLRGIERVIIYHRTDNVKWGLYFVLVYKSSKKNVP